MYRRTPVGFEVLIAHPGGPFWAHREEGAWSLPKGVLEAGEDAETAARREFEEETAHPASGPAVSLGSVRQKSGKIVHGFGVEGDADPEVCVSNVIDLEWPPRSGRRMEIPEVDRVAWHTPEAAKTLLNPAQAVFVDRLAAYLSC